MLPIQTILHPTDFSERSAYAFELACFLARHHGARLLVLHVVPPPQSVGYDEQPMTPVLSPDYTKQEAAKLLQLQSPDPAVRVEHRQEIGFAADEIIRVARETSADLIVMGTHGRTGLVRLVMGSVAEQVLRNASCPVLAVKTPVKDTTREKQKA